MLGKKRTTPPPIQPAARTTPPPAQPTGLALQVLTAGYIADGFLSPIEMPLVGYLNVPTQVTIAMHSARVRMLGVNADAGQALPEIIVPKSTMIALIPQNEAALRSAGVQLPTRAERAVIYAGPYLIHGSFRLMGDMPLWNLFNALNGDMLVVSDAEIRCQLPGVNFPNAQPTLLVLNKSRVQLYHPAQ